MGQLGHVKWDTWRVSHLSSFNALKLDKAALERRRQHGPERRDVEPGHASDLRRLSRVSGQRPRAPIRHAGDFQALSEAIYQILLSQPNFTAKDLPAIRGPRIEIVDGEREEVIKPEHSIYLATTIPGAKLIILSNVSHCAPIQDPADLKAAMLTFLDAP